MLWSENKSKYRHSFLDSTTTLSTSVFSVFLCQIQGQYFRIHTRVWHNTCCQVSSLGTQKTTDFCLNLKFLFKKDSLISSEIEINFFKLECFLPKDFKNQMVKIHFGNFKLSAKDSDLEYFFFESHQTFWQKATFRNLYSLNLKLHNQYCHNVILQLPEQECQLRD